MELEMGLLCFLSPIFHRGCSPTGERNISLWFAAAALPHPQLHNEGTWRIKSHREQQVCGGQGAGMLFGSSPDLPPACPKQCPPQAPGTAPPARCHEPQHQPSILPAAPRAAKATAGIFNSSFSLPSWEVEKNPPQLPSAPKAPEFAESCIYPRASPLTLGGLQGPRQRDAREQG